MRRCKLSGGKLFPAALAWLVVACGPSELKPVDLYPEDICSACRMAISDESFAAEIITASQEIFKFDDIGCMERFRQQSTGLKIAVIFVKDYESKSWMPYALSVIVRTGIKTPMGSGKAAFPDSAKAAAFATKHPLTAAAGCPMNGEHSCCAPESVPNED